VSIALVQQSAATATWSASYTASPTLPANSTANNVVLIPCQHAQFDDNTTSYSASGYSATPPANQASAIVGAGLLYKVTTGGAETPTVNAITAGGAGDSYGTCGLAEFSGLNTSSPFVSADSNTATGVGTALSVSTGNPLSQASALIVAVYSGNGSLAGGTWPPAGWTNLWSNLAQGWAFAFIIVASNAQVTAAMTITTALQWAASLTVFTAAAGAPTVYPFVRPRRTYSTTTFTK
jgi:hypothetical protein